MKEYVRSIFALAVTASGLAHTEGALAQSAVEGALAPAEKAAPVLDAKPVSEAPQSAALVAAVITPAPAPVVPAPAPVAPPVAAAAPKKDDGPPLVRAYGIVRAVFNLSNGVESFLNENASAITAAAHPVFHLNPNARYLSFEGQQSRFGLVAGEGRVITGKIEGDFIQFNLSNPTTASLFRLRIANIDWNLAPGHKLFIGQNWDTAMTPGTPHISSLVGFLNLSGNAGFMRHQLGYAGTFGHIETQLALGMQGANNNPGVGNIEFGGAPTFALRVGYRVNPESWFGATGIVTALRFTDTAVPTAASKEERRPAWGASVFADMTFGKVNLRAKAYVAQNLANTGTLTLAGGRFGQDVRDAGGLISLKVSMKSHSMYVSSGAAAVLDTSVMAPGYTPAVAATATTPAAPAVRGTMANPGIEWNSTIHVGYAYSPMKGVSLLIEPYLYRTRFRLDAASAFAPNRTAYGVEVGGLYSF